MSSETETSPNLSTPDTSKPAATNSNPFNVLISLWVTPTSAYRELKPNTRFWYPFIALILAQVVVTVYYSMSVDIAWMMEQTLASSGRDFSPEQREAMVRMQENMGATVQAVIGSVGVVVMFSLIFSIVAGYFTLVSSFTADNIRFKQWFGFVCWSATPMLFAALASCVTIFLNSNGQILQTELNPLSFNSLLFKLPFGETGSTFLSSLDLTSLWGIALYVIGYQAWTGKSIQQSFLIAGVPFIALTAIAAIFIFI